ncbi:response regulator [Brachybacterium fresconis]|uniref:DNA-binding NarL/FixJ family response regulator n=1 Tax=Brachybacterium fresconis TaxID=173363 RepID=A0ABS4YK26_9MICO|nr:response regulator transcription factor [Brachybacterium fresconis]MBP2409158.1 DNA-binding NarL/FixJ family response regulator [Brachybacterium fresconis]
MIRVLLADDQDLVRAGLRALLDGDDGLSVTAEAHSGREAVELTRRHRPDVVLMDIRMPGTDGIAATAEITADPDLTAVRVLILTTFDEDAEVFAAIRAGAAGYLLKDTPAAELRAGVRTIAGGENLLSPRVARQVMAQLATTAAPVAPDPRLERLTERELAVLRRVALGDTNAEIAQHLVVSPATARTYISRILAKLDARDRTELAVLAHRWGLFSEDDA